MDLDLKAIQQRIKDAHASGAFGTDEGISFTNMLAAADDCIEELRAIKARLDADIWVQFTDYPKDLRPCREEGHQWPRWTKHEQPRGTFGPRKQSRQCSDCRMRVERIMTWIGVPKSVSRDQSECPDYRIPGSTGHNRLYMRNWNALYGYEDLIKGLELAEQRASRRGGKPNGARRGHLRAVS